MLGKKIGMDLGTETVRLVVKGEGPPASEPAVVGVSGSDQSVVVGMAALEHGESLRLVRPVAGGLIADGPAVRVLVQHLVSRVVGRQRIFKPDVVMGVTSSLPGEQRRLLLDAAMAAGARTVYLLDAPIAAALGAGIRLGGPGGHLVIDAGAGKTDVAVLAMEGTEASRSLAGHGGDQLAAAVVAHVGEQHGAALDRIQVHEVITSLARVGSHEERRLVLDVRRRGEPLSLELTSTELLPLLEAHARPIAEAVSAVIDEAPAALRQDVRRAGGVLCGGASRLEGLAAYLGALTGIPMRCDREPQMCAVRGTGAALDNLDVLKRTFMYIR